MLLLVMSRSSCMPPLIDRLTTRPSVRCGMVPQRSCRDQLFDHPVGDCEQCRRHRQTERLRGLQVDHQFELGRLYDRKVGRLPAPENAAGVKANLVISAEKVRSIAQKTPG